MTLGQAFEQLKTLVETEIAERGRSAAASLNQNVRQVRSVSNESDLAKLLVSSVGDRSACLSFEQDHARVLALRGETLPSVRFPIQDSPALVSAIETKDTVITTALVSELSEPLAGTLETEGKVHLIPVVANGAVQLVMVAPGNVGDLATLCEAAGLRLEALAFERELAKRTERATEPGPDTQPEQGWNKLPAAEQALHLRAQRFAQVAVARMRVEQAAAVREGQQNQNIYGSLRGSIDEARAEFRKQFFNGESKTMVDYLYVELLRSLANDQDRLLGPDFPRRLT